MMSLQVEVGQPNLAIHLVGVFTADGRFPRYNSVITPTWRHSSVSRTLLAFLKGLSRTAFVALLSRLSWGRGVPITDVAQWVGHKDINVTYDTTGTWCPTLQAGT
jgi:hypothetical protein